LQRLEVDSPTWRVVAPTPMEPKLISSGKKLVKLEEIEFLNHLKCWEESSLSHILVSAILARKYFAISTTY